MAQAVDLGPMLGWEAEYDSNDIHVHARLPLSIGGDASPLKSCPVMSFLISFSHLIPDTVATSPAPSPHQVSLSPPYLLWSAHAPCWASDAVITVAEISNNNIDEPRMNNMARLDAMEGRRGDLGRRRGGGRE